MITPQRAEELADLIDTLRRDEALTNHSRRDIVLALRQLATTERAYATATEAMQDDIGTLFRTLGLSDHPRAASPHQTMTDEIIPAVAAVMDVVRPRGRLGCTRYGGHTGWCDESHPACSAVSDWLAEHGR